MATRRRPWGLALAVLAIVALLAAPADGAAKAKVSISVLSGRADLVSGDDALIEIRVRRGVGAGQVHVTVDPKGGEKRNVTSAFRRRGHRLVGIVTRLELGRNVVRATLRDGSGARLALINHPHGGPVFAGPQLQPWTCPPTALDAQCNQPPSFSYLYKSTDPSRQQLQPYDAADPPPDVATTTTDSGVEVPFIVRVETGYIDRDQYKIAALYQPAEGWTGVRPQPQFAHKLLVFHGFACGVEYRAGTAPDVTEGIAPDALGRGFATMSTALAHNGHNCNLLTQAESLVMAKEHLIEDYGTLRYTIGTGCSGGSLTQQWVANAYPGVYQGILPTCSFPDTWSTATQFLDYHLLLAYFNDPSRWAPGVSWTSAQIAAVEGHPNPANAEISEGAQFHVVVPTDPCGGTTAAERYDPQTNPGGVRCSIVDAAINAFGPNPEATWSPQEQALGHGFAAPPVDNVGVQYGLGALERGEISPGQFVDLNSKIGGIDIDTNPTAERIPSPGSALANAYRSGMINETNNLARTAIIDCRGPDEGLFHDAYRAFAIRARLDREHGGHANQLIWEGPVPLTADGECERNSFIAMDRWLAAIEDDSRDVALARKVAEDKPDDLTDRCYDGAGDKVSDTLCPDTVVRVYGTPRMVAGDAITTDTNKCQTKPLERGDYRVGFTDAQWAELESTFPDGVCDFSKPGTDQQDTIPWQTYQRRNGDVIYGGRPLGLAPKSKRLRP
jgi:Tannase-like family of unknown function (DUF6351)